MIRAITASIYQREQLVKENSLVLRFIYYISSNRHLGICFHHDHIDLAFKWGWHLFQGGVYLLYVLVHIMPMLHSAGRVQVHGHKFTSVHIKCSLFQHLITIEGL